MNYNPSPKSEFIKNSEAVRLHHELVEKPSLHIGFDCALLEMSRQICNNAPADNMGACAASHLRMLGAQDFIQIFMNLAESPALEAKKDLANLPSNVSSLPRKN